MKNLKKFRFAVDVSQEDGCMLGVEKLLCYPKYIECLEVEVEYRITTYRAPTYYEPEEPKEAEIYKVDIKRVFDYWNWDKQGCGVWTPTKKQLLLLDNLVFNHFQEEVEVACWENEERESTYREVTAFRCSEFGSLI